MANTSYDAVIVGSGPNGLGAAIVLARAGLRVVVLEAKPTIGGGTRSAQLTLPGFVHDVGSAIHPLAAGSPFFEQLPLADYGLEWIYPPVAAAHPFDAGRAAILTGSVADTARTLGADETTYLRLFEPIVRHWPTLAPDLLGPLRFPKHPLDLAQFGLNALLPATTLAGRFQTPEAQGLLAGMAAHAIQPLTNLTTSAIALVLMAAGHHRAESGSGWPLPKGGSQTIADALAAYLRALGGEIIVDRPVRSPADVPAARAVLFDLTPKQLLTIAGDQFTYLYRTQLQRYRYGPGIFKIDWALDGPIPWANADCARAGTVHLGGTLEDIVQAEQQTYDGYHPDRPYVLLAQQSLFDATRAPAGRDSAGKHTAWAYCHVPNGSTVDMTDRIERQVERFAPGFRDLILGRHTMNTTQIEAWNPNYVGGDINGGILDVGQLFTRPTLSLTPYRTSRPDWFICSSATPPGGGVHGMCGYHAARVALRDVFGMNVPVRLTTV